jgi:hypothetical protein
MRALSMVVGDESDLAARLTLVVVVVQKKKEGSRTDTLWQKEARVVNFASVTGETFRFSDEDTSDTNAGTTLRLSIQEALHCNCRP